MEVLCAVEIALSMIVQLGVANGHNVALALFTLFSIYTQIGRANAVAGLAHFYSILMDLAACMVNGASWTEFGDQKVFGMSLLVILQLVKIAIVLCCFFINAEVGFEFPTAFQSSNALYSEIPPAAGPGDVDIRFSGYQSPDVLQAAEAKKRNANKSKTSL